MSKKQKGYGDCEKCKHYNNQENKCEDCKFKPGETYDRWESIEYEDKIQIGDKFILKSISGDDAFYEYKKFLVNKIFTLIDKDDLIYHLSVKDYKRFCKYIKKNKLKDCDNVFYFLLTARFKKVKE